MVSFNATVSTAPMRDLGADLVGPQALTDSNRFVVSMVCRFSRWSVFVAVPDATADHLQHLVLPLRDPTAHHQR